MNGLLPAIKGDTEREYTIGLKNSLNNEKNDSQIVYYMYSTLTTYNC
jgi:hypothetical protein